MIQIKKLSLLKHIAVLNVMGFSGYENMYFEILSPSPFGDMATLTVKFWEP